MSLTGITLTKLTIIILNSSNHSLGKLLCKLLLNVNSVHEVEESSEDEVVLSVLEVLLSSDFAHEETNTAILTIRTNQKNILFKLFLFKLLKK